MADTKISALTSATPVLTDETIIVDDPGGTPSSKKVTFSAIRTLMDFQEKPSEGAFANGDKTKLDAIEAGADVTDTANLTAAGAIMDSEVANLADLKAFDPADYATAAQGATADTATQPGDSWATLDGTAWRVAYTNGTGDVTELALGADGTFLKSNGAAAAPSFATPTGSGDVSKVGTPVENQVAVWTGDGTLEGISALTYDATNFVISADFDPNADGTINLGNATNRFASISVDSIDLNGTTFTGTTLADPDADAFLGWDDSAGETIFFSIGNGLTASGADISADVESVAGETGAITAGSLRTALNVEDGADVTDAANVETAIEGITLSAVTGATGDEVLIVDATDGGLKAVLWQNLPGAGGGLTDVVDDTTPQLGGDLDGQGNEIANYTNAVVGTVSGTLTVGAHSGNVIVTSGNVTVPTTAGFTCTIIAGGAHTVSFNSTTSAAMATGDVMTVVVEDSTTIHAVLTAAADKVSFS